MNPYYVCPVCSKAFASERSLRSHRVRNGRGLACPYQESEKVTARETARRQYAARIGSDNRKLRWQCACGRRFPTLYARGAHQGHQPVGSVCRPLAGESTDARLHKAYKARRRRRQTHYYRRWRKRNPRYHAEWARAHREKERARRRRYYQAHPEKRKRGSSRRRLPEVTELPELFVGHPLFDLARSLVGPRPYFDPFNLWEDVMGDTVLAAVEGVEPLQQTVRESRRKRRIRQFLEAQFMRGADVTEDGRVVLQSDPYET